MVEIRKITDFSLADLNSLGFYGYRANDKYAVVKYCKNNELIFKISKVALDKTFIREWSICEDDFFYYSKILKQNLSFGAFDKNQLIGIILIEKKQWNNSLFITLIHVSDKHRNQGIGSKLLARAKEVATQNNIRIISLETQNTNVNAIEFYKKNGYAIDSLDISLYDNNYPDNEVAFFMKHKL